MRSRAPVVEVGPNPLTRYRSPKWRWSFGTHFSAVANARENPAGDGVGRDRRRHARLSSRAGHAPISLTNSRRRRRPVLVKTAAGSRRGSGRQLLNRSRTKITLRSASPCRKAGRWDVRPRFWDHRSMSDHDTADSESSGTECPTCGRTDFKSNAGMRQHHARAHGESLTTVSLECEWCGAGYEKIRAKAEGSRFCSNDCKFEWLHEHRRGRDYVDVGCSNCGKTLQRHPYEVENSDDFFCGRDCHSEWLTGENHHNWNGGRLEVDCSICGTTVERYPSTVRDHDRVFCSDECQYTWVSENHVGEDHSRWKGGVSHGYPGGWKEQRQKSRERDENRCRACGITNEEHNELYGYNLDVHHVVPVREFDDPEDAHSLGNLVTACRSCHMKYEGLPVFPE